MEGAGGSEGGRWRRIRPPILLKKIRSKDDKGRRWRVEVERWSSWSRGSNLGTLRFRSRVRIRVVPTFQ